MTIDRVKIGKVRRYFADGERLSVGALGAMIKGAYGEEMPYTRNGHSGYQIRWNVSVLDELSDSEEWLE